MNGEQFIETEDLCTPKTKEDNVSTEKKDFYLSGIRNVNGHLLIRIESEDNMFTRFTKHDVSLHVLNLDTKTGMVEVEICVRGARHVGIYHTHMVLDTPGCLLADIKKATENLLDQQGPFKRSGNQIYKKDAVGGFTSTVGCAEDLDGLVKWLNKTWRENK